MVLRLSDGSFRNHCPYSRYLDLVPGDRAESRGGLMEPTGLRYRAGKGWQVVHRCLRCGAVRPNRVAADTVQPDDPDALAWLARLAGRG